MLSEMNVGFNVEEYLSIESLADFFEEEAKSIRGIDLGLAALLDDMKRERGGFGEQKRIMYDFLMRELPYYWNLLQADFKESVSIENIKQIVNDMPEQKASILHAFLKSKLIALLEINEDLLQSCVFHYSKTKERGGAVKKSDIFNVYKNVYAKNKKFTLNDLGLVISEYEKEYA